MTGLLEGVLLHIMSNNYHMHVCLLRLMETCSKVTLIRRNDKLLLVFSPSHYPTITKEVEKFKTLDG